MKPIVVSMGDPAGCGPLLCEALWRSEILREKANKAVPLVFIGCERAFAAHQIKVNQIADIQEGAQFPIGEGPLPLFQTDATLAPIRPGKADTAHAPAIIDAIKMASKSVLNREASALITAPIAKSVLYEAGFDFPGHTEFLAHLSGMNPKTDPPIMMLVGAGLRVALATIHIPLHLVSGSLSISLLSRTAQIVHRDLRTKFGLNRPRIAFSGLNPHAGENGTIGREELDIINPAAQNLRDAFGIDISDARPADTVFHEARAGQFDAVIAMTHDQALIPVKTLDLWGGVNVTLGLPLIRTSPDHGTAFDATKKNALNPRSMFAAYESALAQIEAQNASLAAV